MSRAIQQFLGHAVWQHTHRARLIPLCEAAEPAAGEAGSLVFGQFHPAERFHLLVRGAVAHEASGGADVEPWSMGQVSWPWGALGWSGFLPPFRNGTTARALTPVELLTWRHEDLANIFYADPGLAVDFFRIVIDSARRQFEWIRDERLVQFSNRQVFEPPPPAAGKPDRHRFAPSLISALRRSSFFELFDDAALERLAGDAELVRRERNCVLVRQGEDTAGLLVLASGRAVSYFATGSRNGERVDRFRTIPEHGGILAGMPTLNGRYRAEAKVVSASTCWFYRIPVAAIEAFMAEDPEFGRSYMQRHLGRLAHLMSAARPPKPLVDEEPEIAAVKHILDQNQTRIPVTSELHKVPHLLGHRMTMGHAFASLNAVQEAGRYQERSIARSCTDLLAGMQAEQLFYRDVLTAYTNVIEAGDEHEPAVLRGRCDEDLARAFSHLRTEIHGFKNMPPTSGNIVIMNHLACPGYYQLPNNYHFSFDTAFVSVLLNAFYGRSPVRVVRASPGIEYGHDLFYSRLGHITVPTVESGLEASEAALERLRRESSARLLEQGREALGRGDNVLICPEGQSQRACDSPARFYSGAFRLALATEPEPWIVPIAIAGFDQRYKDAKLVAVVQEPIRVSERMRQAGLEDLRSFIDGYRVQFSGAVKDAQRASRGRDVLAETSSRFSDGF